VPRVRAVNDPTPGRSPVEQPPPKAPGGRPAPTAADLAGLPVVITEQTTHAPVSAGHGSKYDLRQLAAKDAAPGRWPA